ncbi:MAG: hypothetical protein GX753_06075 [Erysipelothrix sp.]|nr:hypothetical protein [Erysipelothrix sp.]
MIKKYGYIFLSIILLSACANKNDANTEVMLQDSNFAKSENNESILIFTEPKNLVFASFDTIVHIDNKNVTEVYIDMNWRGYDNDDTYATSYDAGLGNSLQTYHVSEFQTDAKTLVSKLDIAEVMRRHPEYIPVNPSNIDAFIQDNKLFYTFAVYIPKNINSDSNVRSHPRTVWITIDAHTEETQLVTRNFGAFEFDSFYTHTNFLELNNIKTYVKKRTLDSIQVLELKPSRLPNENTNLYSLFPGLKLRQQKDQNIESYSNSFNLYFEKEKTPDEIFELLSEEGSKTNWNGVLIKGEYTLDGQDYMISSYQDYQNYIEESRKQQ